MNHFALDQTRKIGPEKHLKTTSFTETRLNGKHGCGIKKEFIEYLAAAFSKSCALTLGLDMVFVYQIRLKTDQKRHKMDQKG